MSRCSIAKTNLSRLTDFKVCSSRDAINYHLNQQIVWRISIFNRRYIGHVTDLLPPVSRLHSELNQSLKTGERV